MHAEQPTSAGSFALHPPPVDMKQGEIQSMMKPLLTPKLRAKPPGVVRDGIRAQPATVSMKMISGSNTVLIIPLVAPFYFRNRVRPYRSSGIALRRDRRPFKTD
jgi:hypothetical protein